MPNSPTTAAGCLLPGTPGTSTRCARARPAAPSGSLPPQRGHGTAGAPVDAARRPGAVERRRASACAPPRAPSAARRRRTSPSRRHGETRASHSASAFQRLPDAGHEPLVEQGVADLALRCCVRSRRETSSRNPAARRGCPARAAAPTALPDKLEHGAVPEHGLVLGAPQDEPRLAGARLLPRRSTRQRPFIRRWLRRTRTSRPRSGAGGSCPPPRPPRAAGRRAARRRRFTAARGCGVSTSTQLADENLQPPGRAVERIPFRHRRKPTIQA